MTDDGIKINVQPVFGVYCYRCGAPASTFYNTSYTLASGTPSKFEPVCDEHNPFRVQALPASPRRRSKKKSQAGQGGRVGEHRI